MSPLSYLWLLPIGTAAGAVGTLMGAGGGVFVVPFLLLVFPELPAAAVVETSLIMVLANAISGTVAYARQDRIHYPSGIRFAVATLPGAVAGAWVVQRTATGPFQALFGALLLVVAVVAGFRVRRSQWQDAKTVPKPDWRGVAASVVVGFLASFFGIGGGVLHVPLLVAWLGYPVHVATATSHFVLALTALAAVATHMLTRGLPPHYSIALWLAAGAVPGAVIGAWLSRRLTSRAIALALATGLALLGARLLAGATGLLGPGGS